MIMDERLSIICDDCSLRTKCKARDKVVQCWAKIREIKNNTIVN